MITGVKSTARSIVLGGVDKPPMRTGFAAYRATVEVEKMKKNPETAKLLEKDGLHLWYTISLQN